MDINSVGKRFNIEVLIHGEKVDKSLTLIEIEKKKFIFPKKWKGGTLFSSKGIIRSI